jgi:hypothetical protein
MNISIKVSDENAKLVEEAFKSHFQYEEKIQREDPKKPDTYQLVQNPESPEKFVRRKLTQYVEQIVQQHLRNEESRNSAASKFTLSPPEKTAAAPQRSKQASKKGK